MNLIDRVKNILLTPKTEWEVIKAESTPQKEIITGYVLPLAAVSAVCGFLGTLFVAYAFLGLSFLLYGVLDVPNKRLTYCNAGHPPGLLLRGGKVTELNVNNMVLGVTCDEQYTQSTLDLKHGDTLLFYTDGLADAMNFNKERFGRERIIEAFKQGGATADIIAQNILWNARRFVGLTERNDDITMLVARIG